MSMEVANVLRQARMLIADPGHRIINNCETELPDGSSAYCLGAAIAFIEKGDSRCWTRVAAFKPLGSILRQRIETGQYLPEPKFGPGGCFPTPWEMVWHDNELIAQFNNSATHEEVLALLDEAILSVAGPKVPTEEAPAVAEPDEGTPVSEPDDETGDDDEEAVAARERVLEFA